MRRWYGVGLWRRQRYVAWRNCLGRVDVRDSVNTSGAACWRYSPSPPSQTFGRTAKAGSDCDAILLQHYQRFINAFFSFSCSCWRGRFSAAYLAILLPFSPLNAFRREHNAAYRRLRFLRAARALPRYRCTPRFSRRCLPLPRVAAARHCISQAFRRRAVAAQAR